jgi:CRISPR system Cascade subunit CasA
MKKPMPGKPRESEHETRATFDLRDEPWVPVIRKDGKSDELSLRDALRDAPNLREVRDPMPTVEFGVYRLLVALALDIFELSSADDLETLLSVGEFDAKQVNKYFDDWADRFDLFHPKYPFLQSPGMKDEKPKPLAGLVHPLPSGTNANHFHHGDEREFGVCPAAAARLLTTIAPFMTAGGAGLSPSINGAPPWYVLVRGATLFETLCLNCQAVRDQIPHAEGDEPPAWRSDRAVSAKRRNSASLCESLTWRPRRIQLLRGGPGRCSLTGRESRVLVREMKFSAGFAAGFDWTDPNVAYRIGDDDRTVLRPREGKAVWRDTAPIALLRKDTYQSESGKRFDRPAIISQFARLHEREMLKESAPLELSIYGIRTDMKKKVFEWHREQLSLPVPLVLRTQFHGLAQQAMVQAEKVDYALRQAIRKVYPRDGAGNGRAYESLIARAQNDFWNSLRPHYTEFLEAIAALGDSEDPALTKRWRDAIRQIAERALREAIEDIDTDADALERQTAALRGFAFALYLSLNPEAAAKAKAAKKQRAGKEKKQ